MTTEKRKARFQSAFKVPANRKIIQSQKITGNSEDSDSDKFHYNWRDEYDKEAEAGAANLH